LVDDVLWAPAAQRRASVEIGPADEERHVDHAAGIHHARAVLHFHAAVDAVDAELWKLLNRKRAKLLRGGIPAMQAGLRGQQTSHALHLGKAEGIPPADTRLYDRRVHEEVERLRGERAQGRKRE